MFVQNLKEYKQKAQSSYSFEDKILLFTLYLETHEILLSNIRNVRTKYNHYTVTIHCITSAFDAQFCFPLMLML